MALRITIVSPNQTKSSELAEAINLYTKRMQGRLAIDWVEIRSDEQFLPHLPAVALCPSGSPLTSEQFSRSLFKLFATQGSRLHFWIGGPSGITPSILKQASQTWSLSPLTFPHQLVRLLLVEQIYRALEIERGSPYHK